MAKSKKQKYAAAAKRKAKQTEIQMATQSAYSQDKKNMELHFNKLVDAMTQLSPMIDAYINEISEHCPAVGGKCILRANITLDLLQERGFDKLKIVGGRAAFGFNNGSRGVLDYGYASDAFTVFSSDKKVNFNGHAWLEDTEYGFIIDPSIPELPSSINDTNQAMGIAEEPILLDVSRTVLRKEEIISDAVLRTPLIGYHYSKPDSVITENVHNCLAHIRQLKEFATIKADSYPSAA
ncbi:hypothetical protein F2K62_002723 [Vibrio fluvialis]|nr:hypothetical protein [Vibrio fluvialis]